MIRPALLLLPCAALLTSCASPERVVTVREPVVMRSPEALRSCEPAPAVPGPEATNGQIAAFILELFAAGDDCRATLAELVAWEEEAAARTAP